MAKEINCEFKKGQINCDFNSANTVISTMQTESTINNKMVSSTKFNTIDTTNANIESQFGNQLDVSTQVASLVNQLKIDIEADTDTKLDNFETKIEHNVNETLNMFEQRLDVKIDNELNEFEQYIDASTNIKLDEFRVDVSNEIDEKFIELDTTIAKKYVPQRLNAFGTLDISGDIIPDKAYMYVDVNGDTQHPTSTRVDLADVITTKVVTEDINPDTSLRTYDYIFTKLVLEGEN